MKNIPYKEKNKNPLVSICIPIYNGEKYLIKCLDSAINQTYKNIEIIISDDGSSDKSIEIASERLKKSTVKYKIIFNNTKNNCVANWNNTIKNSSGDYIKMLFQDDYLNKNCIEIMIKKALKYKNVGLIFSLRKPLLDDKNISSKIQYNSINRQKQYLYNLKEFQKGTELFKNKAIITGVNAIGEPSNVLINKFIFKQIGYFDTSLKQWIDFEMWHRIALNFNVIYINKILSTFRIHENQLTSINIKRKNQDIFNEREERLFVYKKLYNNLKKINFKKLYLTRLKRSIVVPTKDDIKLYKFFILRVILRYFLRPLIRLYFSILIDIYKIFNSSKDSYHFLGEKN